MRSGALGQNGRAVHLASIEEEEYESLTADAKKSGATYDAKAPGSFPFPLATNRSKKIPPRPCRNCGSVLHYDRDCASWRNRDRPTTKALPASKANSAYQASYMAMLEDLDEEYQEQCDVFHTALNEAVEATVLTAEISSSNLPANVPASVAELRTEALSLSSEECSWESLPALVAADEPPWESPSEKVYKPRPIWERPAGHAVQGVDAFKLLCHVNSLQEPAAIVVGDSGAAPTLISQRFLDSLKLSKPRRRTGRKLNLIQLTGTAGCSEYVRLNLYFQSQKGPVCLKGVEAYVVKGMVANLIIGEDTQLAWQLHTIRPNGTRHWKVGDSAYRIPGTTSPAPAESFTVQWAPEPEAKEPAVKPVKKLAPEEAKKHWNALAKYDVLIKPESIATVTAVARGAPNQEAMYLEGTPLKRGSASFICAPDGMVDPDSEGCFQIKIANTTHRHIKLRAGESLGQVFKANDALKATSQLTENERLAFAKRVAQLAALTPSLDAAQAGHETQTTLPEGETIGSQPETFGWGPKT